MAKRGKRGKKIAAKLRKKLGFLPSAKPKLRFGSLQARIEIVGKANKLDKTRLEIQQQLDRKQKQRGWGND